MMTPLEKLREQTRIAAENTRTTGGLHCVVLTPEEAQAVLDAVAWPIRAHLRCERCASEQTIRFDYATASAPPHEGEDEHV